MNLNEAERFLVLEQKVDDIEQILIQSGIVKENKNVQNKEDDTIVQK